MALPERNDIAKFCPETALQKFRKGNLHMIKNDTAAEYLKDFSLPKYNEIPDVGLFLEQVAKYVEGILSPLEGITITSSMISNYVKQKLIDSPVKKQYSRDQIVYIIFIAIAKSVLTLDEIRTLINVRKKDYDCCRLYEYFCNEFEYHLFSVFGITDRITREEAEADNEDRVLLHNTVITATHKIYLDMIFSIRKENQEA